MTCFVAEGVLLTVCCLVAVLVPVCFLTDDCLVTAVLGLLSDFLETAGLEVVVLADLLLALLLACARASVSNAVNVNPNNITANIVLTVLMIKKF